MVKNKITLNVLADITKRIGNVSTKAFDENNKANKNIFSKKSGKALIVFTGSDINIEEKLDFILELKEMGVSLSLAFSCMGEKILDVESIKRKLRPENIYLEEDILKLKEVSFEHNYIISPNITINTMSKLTQGLIDDFIANLLWTFLYTNKGVYIDFESTLNYLGLECKNKKIESIILKQINDVKDLGVIELGTKSYKDTIYKQHNFRDTVYKDTVSREKEFSNDLDITREIDRNTFNAFDNSKLETIKKESSQKRKIYTGNDIANASVQDNTLIVKRGSIITPLAKDKIRSMGISIKFE